MPGGEVGVGELDEAGAVEARFVTSVYDTGRHVAEPLHRLDVRRDVAVGQVVEQQAVVDRVDGEQGGGRRFPQADAARRVSGKVHHLECAVAQIDHVPVPDPSRHGGRRHRVAPRVVPLTADRGHEVRGVERCVEIGGLHPLDELPRQVRGRECGELPVVLHPTGLQRMHHPFLELVQPTDVIPVDVRRDGDDPVIDDTGDLVAE